MMKNKALRCMIKRISILGITILLLWPCYFFINYAIAALPTMVMVESPYPEEGAHFGMGVSGISDINGDGVGDLAVGAPGADTVYLLSGSNRVLILAIEDPDGLVGYSFGYSVQAVGDINLDGIEDVAVGAPALGEGLSVPNPDCWNPDSEWYDHPICDAPFGRAFVLSGANGELLVRFRYYRPLFGYAIAALGDVNSDGIPDVAVSSPFLWPNLGAVVAFSGADGSLLWERIEPEPDWGGNQPMASFGLFMTVVDDINADGYRDVLVGAPFHSYGASASESIAGGKGFVLSGGDGTILRGHDNLTPSNNDYFGAGPAAIGDQNGDGVADYMFSETRSGLVHVYSGSTGETIATISNPGGGNPDLFGFQSARAGDRDWDGVEDVWIAAPDDTFLHGDADGGLLYLMNGSNDVLFEISDPDTLVFEDSYGFGWRVAVTEDLNGDGVPDVMVGEPARSAVGQAEAGVVYLVLGGFENRPPVADAGADQTVPVEPDCLAVVTLDGSGSHDPDGDTLSYSWTWDVGSAIGVNPMIQLPLGTTSITLVVNDGNVDSEPDYVDITVIDNTPPKPDLEELPTVIGECSANITSIPTAIDHCAGMITGTTADSLEYTDQGTYIVTWTYDDGNGNISTQTQTVIVKDTTSPSIGSITANPNVLRLPNHKMLPVSIIVTASDNCDPAPICRIVSVSSNEPLDGLGDGDMAPDWVITGPLTVNLRAERSGKGSGRIYTITVQCADAFRNSSNAHVKVTVPHDKGKKK